MIKVLIAVLLLTTLSACASSGLEARIGFYREDVRQQSSKTYDKPLKCLFVSCESSQENQGS